MMLAQYRKLIPSMGEKHQNPYLQSETDLPQQKQERSTFKTLVPFLLVLPFISTPVSNSISSYFSTPAPTPAFVSYGLAQCTAIQTPPPSFDSSRKVSDRFVPGTKNTILKNGTVWTGNKNGSEIIYEGTVALENGLIKFVGTESEARSFLGQGFVTNAEEIDVGGKWISPGLVDLHSHLGVFSAPVLKGSDDTNSVKAPILPYLRSLDGINTHDLSYQLSAAGGITTALVLPGSANNIGGQAFVIKPRVTDDNLPSSMVVENPFVIGENGTGMIDTGRWRHMKHACGENIHGLYGDNRMDQAYNFRKAYLTATKLKEKQDAWCAKGAGNTEEFPESLEFEALVDVLRGRVALNVHCYESVDFDQLIRLTNEFKIELSAVHHAHEAYLVTDLLKKAWGRIPAAAIFAVNGRYKREAYRGSEFAPKILHDEGIPVVMKSDHPVLDSRYLIYEAAQAAKYGLNWTVALAAVTTTPAKAMRMDHRLGSVKIGYDADVVVWDSHPLALGATPTAVFIDGINQISDAFSISKPAKLQEIPKAPCFAKEAEKHKTSHGDHDWLPEKKAASVVFTDVKNIFIRDEESGELLDQSSLLQDSVSSTVVVKDGAITCIGSCASVASSSYTTVDLQGGSIFPGLTSYGGPLGMAEITSEASTQDGQVLNIIDSKIPAVLEGELIRAVDGAIFGTKDMQIAAKFGVTKGVTSPQSSGPISGLSYAFSTSASNPLSLNAIIQQVTALHISISSSASLSVSTQIHVLRKALLLQIDDGEGWWKKVVDGEIPLVVAAHKADIIAALINLKKDIGGDLKMTITGAAEAHMLATELAESDIGVILTPSRSYPYEWDQKRILPGHPLSDKTPVSVLTEAGVKVGLGIKEQWSARNTLADAAWAFLSSESLSIKSALALVSTNLEDLLGMKVDSKLKHRDFIAVSGDWAMFESKVVASSDLAGAVNLF